MSTGEWWKMESYKVVDDRFYIVVSVRTKAKKNVRLRRVFELVSNVDVHMADSANVYENEEIVPSRPPGRFDGRPPVE